MKQSRSISKNLRRILEIDKKKLKMVLQVLISHYELNKSIYLYLLPMVMDPNYV